MYLLGYIREMQTKRKDATKNYIKALEMDPTLWCAYERLCHLQPKDLDIQNQLNSSKKTISRVENVNINSIKPANLRTLLGYSKASCDQ